MMSEAEEKFFDRLDGKRPLGEILSDNREARGFETELLMLLISKGLVAFIPPPAEQLDAPKV